MSTALAIASVTAVLRDLLNNGLIDHSASDVVGDVAVTALAPDLIDTTDVNLTSRLNIYFYKVSYNAGWRNVGLPGRGQNGDRLSNPPLALDLHYLLTAYSREELHAEILLGYGMQILHETPVLTRDAIRTALKPALPNFTGTNLPTNLRSLFTSELSEQVELVKISPEALTAEELFNTWSAFSTTYRPSAPYQASVVLIESRRPTTSSALPVLARNIYVVALKQSVVARIRSQTAANQPVLDQPILAGYRLAVEGEGLRAAASGDTLLNVGGVEVAPADADVTDTQILAPIPAGLSAGVHGVQVIHRFGMGTPEAPHRGVESNVVPFVLRPSVVPPVNVANVVGAGSNPRKADITVTFDPPVGAAQRVVLLLNEFQSPLPAPPVPARAYSFIAPTRLDLSNPPATPPPPDASITFKVSGVAAGNYLVRVQVDGAESTLHVDANGQFDAPQVTIP